MVTKAVGARPVYFLRVGLRRREIPAWVGVCDCWNEAPVNLLNRQAKRGQLGVSGNGTRANSTITYRALEGHEGCAVRWPQRGVD